MNILGICNDETASACLMIDGILIAAVSEERLTRKKMHNCFPKESIQFCLKEAGLDWIDIEVVAYAWHKGPQVDTLSKYLDRYDQVTNSHEAKQVIKERILVETERGEIKKREFNKWFDAVFSTTRAQRREYFHHEAHAASAALLSPFDDGIVLTADGRGDFESTVIWEFDRYSGNQFKKVTSSTSMDSLGYFYGRITGLLGFEPMRHEGKITGLAARGNPYPALELCQNMIRVHQGNIISQLGPFYYPFFKPYSDELKTEVSKFRPEDVAAAAQYHLENMIKEYLIFHIREMGKSNFNLMLAGGVFANVRVNQVLKELKEVKNVWVQPQMGDGGLCLGAAALANEELFANDQIKQIRKTAEMQHVYLGPTAFSVKVGQSRAFSIAEAIIEIVKSMSRNMVIGIVQGRMEFGPRALGNRSIICKTSSSDINDILNKRLNRSEFMPFAPMVKRENASQVFLEFLESDKTLNFMTATIQCTPSFIKNSPATVHTDGTARPQIVSRESNIFMWKLLDAWEYESGEKAIVNTSFNVHEEPIVCTLDEAHRSLREGRIDELWLIEEDKALRYLA